jgi:hypothetical protein
MVYAAADARAVEKGIIVVQGVRIIQICVIRTVVIAVVGADVWDTQLATCGVHPVEIRAPVWIKK